MNGIIVVLICSLAALGLGAGVGWFGQSLDRSSVKSGPSSRSAPTPAPSSFNKTLKDIRPIVTNLAEPAGAWLRVELAVVMSGPPNPKLDLLILEFVSDATDFLRTVTAREIEGPSGLRRLREDLFERARYRIGKEVEAVLIETLVVQ